MKIDIIGELAALALATLMICAVAGAGCAIGRAAVESCLRR